MRLLYDVPTPLLVLLLFVAMVAAIEGAQRLGTRLDAETWGRSIDVFVAISGATLALLGLMLAFSFSMSVARFEERMDLLLKEANTIVRVNMLADLLVPKQREHLHALLRQYAEHRIAFMTVGHDEEREQRAIDQANGVQARIWAIVATAENYREPHTVGLLTLAPAVTDMATTARERQDARATRVPEEVLWMMFALAVLASAAVAYTFGASRHGGRLFTFTLAVLVCMVVYIIIDLDRPRRGLMRIDPAPLQEALALIGR